MVLQKDFAIEEKYLQWLDDINRPTCGPSAEAFGDSAGEISPVGVMESELRGCAQELQKRLSGGFGAEHFGH
jgi:hypothetical protein